MIWQTNTIDISIKDYLKLIYEYRPAYGLYDKVIEIEKWFHAERPTISALLNQNTPLVIVGPEGSGRTSLLYQWIQFHEAKSEFFTNMFDKNVYLMHFVNSSNIKNSHYSVIWRLVNRMRSLFDLNQRIEMQNDKVRTFFSRWLELADKKKKSITTDKCKIILIIDGIDRFEVEDNFPQTTSVHQSLNKINYKFDEEAPDWFPQCFPQTFRVILTCKKNSKAYQHFKNMKIPFKFLQMPEIQDDSLYSIVESHFNMSNSIDLIDDLPAIKEQIWSYIQQNRNQFMNHLFLHTFLHVLYPLNIDLNKFKLQPPTLEEIKEYQSPEDLFKHTLKHYETNKILPRSKFRRISCIIALSKTGLKKEELKDCLEVKIDTIEIFLKIFNFALLEHKQLYRVNNECYKKTIEKFYLQEELFKNEIHSSIVTILSKVKHFNSNARLIDEVTYNIYKQGNQWLRLKDLLSNLEIFCQLYKPTDKYLLSQYWQKLEQHGFDPVYEYNKTIEAFVLNYFPTPSELFVILTQLGRFFKELGDLESKCTPEFRHPPLVISPELEQIKLQRELEYIGGMLTENKQNATPMTDEEKYNVDNPLFMSVYREKQVALLRKENPLFPQLQLYYYKRWIWLQFPWFCMDINSAFSTYMNKAMGKNIHLHMNYEVEMDLVIGSLKIIKEAKSRKQLSGKNQIYAVPIEFTLEEEDLQKDREETKYSSSDESFSNKTNNFQQKSTIKNQKGSLYSQSINASIILTPKAKGQNHVDIDLLQGSLMNDKNSMVMTARNTRSQNGNRLQFKNQSQNSRFLQSAQSQRNLMSPDGSIKQSQYYLSKAKWINQDYELANLKSRIKPENAVRVVGNQVKNYERKELETAVLTNREMINELNKIAFEIQQKERIFQSLQNCILQLDSNNKESQAFEKKVSSISEKLDQTRTQYKIARKEQNRLRHIVNFCFKNKADNHEWIQGLELAVSNMVTLIKHEKESIINAKNLVIELKKESKELAKLKNERKQLQGRTTESMYGMISEKQNIKCLRDDFNKRKESIMMGANITEQSYFKSEILDHKPVLHHKHSSPMKQALQDINKSKNRNSTENFYSIQSDTSTGGGQQISDQSKYLIQKLEIMKQSAGVKSIDEYQQIIDFYLNFKRLEQERDIRENKVMMLRQTRNQLEQDLGQYHKQDIEKSNLKYNPHQLVNDLQSKIVEIHIFRNQHMHQYNKARDQVISIRVLIEEMRKQLKLDNKIFDKDFKLISPSEMYQSLNEVQDIVYQRQQLLKQVFGNIPYHETMHIINQMDPKELKARFQKAQKRSRMQQQKIQDELIRTHETPLGSTKQDNLIFGGGSNDEIPKIILNHQSEDNIDQFMEELNQQNFDGILVENIDYNGTQSNGNPIGFQDQRAKTQENRVIGNKRLTKRNSKANYDIGSIKNQNSKQQWLAKKPGSTDEQMLFNIYQVQRPIYLDESSYTQSVMNVSRTLKEKETLFYKRVDEQEKDQDLISQTLQVMAEIKKKHDQVSNDDSFKVIEEERQRLKNKGKQTPLNQNSQRKKKSARGGSQETMPHAPTRAFSQPQLHHIQHQKEQDQDEEPIQGGEDIMNHSNHNKSSQFHNHDLGNRTSRINRFDSKQALEQYLNDEASKLPSYAKSILTNNHKDLIKRIQNLNTNIKKLDKDDLFKKLMVQTEKHKRQKSKDSQAPNNL